MCAAQFGHSRVVSVLLASGANVNIGKSDTGTTALTIALRGGQNTIAEQLRRAGAREGTREGTRDIAMSRTGGTQSIKPPSKSYVKILYVKI